MMQFDTIISIYVRHALTFFDGFMKMEGQKGKCKDDIKSYSLDRFEQVERSKNTPYNQYLRFKCGFD